MNQERLDCLAVAPPGLEQCVVQELRRLELDPGEPVVGGVPFVAGVPGMVRANVHLAVASRVLVRLGRFRARGFAELERKAAGLAWARFLPTGATPTFDVTSKKSRLYHTQAISQRLASVVEGQLAADPRERAREPRDRGESPPTQRFVVRVHRDTVEISADSSGENLHRRGYREHTARAPLRENLAAALLSVAWDPALPMMDPFCGSGTLPIEAARRALGIPPGSDRRFAFQAWPGVRPVLEGDGVPPLAGGQSRSPPPIYGSDRDAGAIRASEANGIRGGVDGHVEWVVAPISELRPRPGPPGWVITNPPYGRRVGRPSDVRNLYARFGQVLRASFVGWQVGVLSADRALAGHMGLDLSPVLRFQNGGIPVELLTGGVTSGI